VAGSSVLELCRSTMFIIYLPTAEFEGFVSVNGADNIGLAGKALCGTSFLNGKHCMTGSVECRGFCVGGKGNCGPSLAFPELAVSLTFVGAVVNDFLCQFLKLKTRFVFVVSFKFRTTVQINRICSQRTFSSSVLKSSLVRFFTSKRGNWKPQPV
jgi:hypothetical protein